jgi:YfiH family protein
MSSINTQPVNIPFYKFQNFSRFSFLNHFITEREGGVSVGEKASLNLSFSVDDSPENVLENRLRLASALGLPLEKIVFPHQAHTDNIAIVDHSDYRDSFDDTDALITNEAGICLTVFSADCAPILLFEPEKRVIAAIHAGWRGAVKKIAGKTIQKMKNDFGCNPEHIIAGIGPCISVSSYEVGDTVIEEVRNNFDTADLLLENVKNGKAHFNLPEAVKVSMMEQGVKAENIETAGICTYRESSRFFSARRSKEAGRFAAGLYMKI